MFAGLLALIPALASLFSSAGGAAAAGTAAGAGAAAGTAGAGATGGATAGGLGGLLGGLFGGSSGGGASSGLGGLLGNLGGLFGQAGAGGPQQLSGPGMEGVMGAVGPGNGPQPAGASGGFNLGSLLGGGKAPGAGSGIQPAGQNMMADLMGGIGRAYMQGALAGKGDFRGALGSLDQQAATANQTARTGIAQQESTRRQEEFDMQKAQQAKVDAANAKIAGIFENPKALEDITQTMGSILPHLLQAGDHAGASAVVNLLSKVATDKKTATALSAATDIARANRQPDGSYDFGKINDGIAALNDPNVSEVYLKSLEPRLMNESNVVNQKSIRQEAAVREDQANKRLDIGEQNLALSERRANESERHNRETENRLGQMMQLRTGTGPLPPAQLPKYINKEGMNPQADPNFNQSAPTHQDLVGGGYARIDNTKVQDTIRTSNIALSQIKRMRGMVDDIYKNVDPGKNLMNAAKLKGQNTLAAGEIRKFKTLVLETLPTMATSSGLPTRSMGENVLFNIELPMLPNDTDSRKSVDDKLDILEQRLTINRNTFFGAGAKIPAQGGSEGGGATPSADEIKAAKKRLGIQ